ncbi:MAG: hypothetical protein MK110_02750 [Fuerstiella sp.]|nr:hypothetical protein [Fuerstiella sp.]
MHQAKPKLPEIIRLLAVFVCLEFLTTDLTCIAQLTGQERTGQFIELPGQISDKQITLVRNQLLELSRRAVREEKEAVMVLKLVPGASTVGNVTDLARVLIDDETSSVKTVAWIQSRITGSHSIVALACHEIMMAPRAALGDVGKGSPVPDDEAAFVRRLVAKRRNPRMAPAIAEAMLNPSAGLVRVGIPQNAGEPDYRFVSPDELTQMLAAGQEVTSTDRIREPGQPAVFTTEEALRLHFMIADAARSDDDVRHAWGLPLAAHRQSEVSDKPVKVAVIAIHGTITPVVAEFVIRETRRSVAEGAGLLIYDIDSPGGYLTSSEEIATTIADLDSATITSVAWIRHDALSGAALSAMGCDQIIMTPDAKIGDIGVIQLSKDGAFDRVPEKLVSPLMVTMETLAKKKDRPVGVLHAMVDRNLQVFEVTHKDTGRRTFMTQAEIDAAQNQWVRGNMVFSSRKGNLLTVNGVEAHELQIAEAPCATQDELQLRLGIPEGTVMKPRASTWVDTLVFVLNSTIGAFALITLGIMCIYLEAHLPGGFFGILSAALFAMFFWSRYLGGTAGTLELVMFVLGTGLLLLEMFVIPGFGVFGVSGILLMLGSLVMAGNTFAGMTTGERFHETMGSLGTVTGALVTVIVVASVLNHFLPSMPVFKHLMLTPPGQISDNELTDPSKAATGLTTVAVGVGNIGTAASTLRPAGKATFNDDYIDVVSEGAYIEHGTAIEVVHIAGNRVVVRPVADT